MKEGAHTFYTIQFRRVKVSPWGKPKGKLTDCDLKSETWWWCSKDRFLVNPLRRSRRGKLYYPYGETAATEFNEVQRATSFGYWGWWSLPIARRILAKLRNQDAEGEYDDVDNDGKVMRAVRREYRLIKVTICYSEDVVPADAPVAGRDSRRKMKK